MKYRLLFASSLLFGIPAVADAQDEDPVNIQKAAAADIIKELKFKTQVLETKDLLLVTDLPAEQGKQLAQYLQRQHAVTWKVLKLKPEERSWNGKLTVYALTQRSDFSSFLRQVEKRQRKDRDESTSAMLTGDTPHLVVGIGLGEDEANLARKTLRQISVMLLQMKAGGNANLPRWIEDGFMKALQSRSGSREARADRAKMQQYAKISPVKDVWEADGERGELLAASFMDYLLFSDAAEKAPAFLRGFAPGQGNQEPNAWKALEVAGMDQKTIEYNWKKWILYGK